MSGRIPAMVSSCSVGPQNEIGKNVVGRALLKYYSGVESVRVMQKEWSGMKNYIDKQRFKQVRQLPAIQEKEAVWWRNAGLLYFQTFSKMPIPANYEKPDKTLEYYKSLNFPLAPGNAH